MLCLRDYAKTVVASFSDQIKSEYYGGNRFVSIEGIELEHLSALPQTEINSSTKHVRDMQCFIIFFHITANNMLPLILHTANV